MPRLSHSSVVHEVLVQLGFQQLPVIVLVNELQYRDTVLLSKGLKDVGKVRSFGLGWDTLTGRSVSRQPGLDVEGRFGHPVGMVLLDGRSHSPFQPFNMRGLILSRQLVVDLQSKIGDEGGLRSSQVLWCKEGGFRVQIG
jgi:hypothetical protein